MNTIKNGKIWRKEVNYTDQQRYAEESVLSALYDSGATSNWGINNYEFFLTDEQSNIIFHMPIVTAAKASVKYNIHHNLIETARTVAMILVLKHNLLVTEINFANAIKITVLKPEEVLIYYGNEVNC